MTKIRLLSLISLLALIMIGCSTQQTSPVEDPAFSDIYSKYEKKVPSVLKPGAPPLLNQ